MISTLTFLIRLVHPQGDYKFLSGNYLAIEVQVDHQHHLNFLMADLLPLAEKPDLSY